MFSVFCLPSSYFTFTSWRPISVDIEKYFKFNLVTCTFRKLFNSMWTIDVIGMSFCLRIANIPLQFDIYYIVRTGPFINSSVPSTGARWTQLSWVIARIDLIRLDDYSMLEILKATSLMTVLTTAECVDYGSCSWNLLAIVRCPRICLLVMSGFPHLGLYFNWRFLISIKMFSIRIFLLIEIDWYQWALLKIWSRSYNFCSISHFETQRHSGLRFQNDEILKDKELESFCGDFHDL